MHVCGVRQQPCKKPTVEKAKTHPVSPWPMPAASCQEKRALTAALVLPAGCCLLPAWRRCHHGHCGQSGAAPSTPSRSAEVRRPRCSPWGELCCTELFRLMRSAGTAGAVFGNRSTPLPSSEAIIRSFWSIQGGWHACCDRNFCLVDLQLICIHLAILQLDFPQILMYSIR